MWLWVDRCFVSYNNRKTMFFRVFKATELDYCLKNYLFSSRQHYCLRLLYIKIALFRVVNGTELDY
jgi:hypothetical protein